MHKIMFACVTLEAVRMMERLYFPLCFLFAFTVHIPLLLQMPDFPSPTHKLNKALVSNEKKDEQESNEGNDVFTPFAYLNQFPKVRKIHIKPRVPSKFRAKLRFFLQMCKFFCTFVADLIV